MKKRLNGWPIVFIGPHMLLFLLFFLVPAVIGIYVSFTEWDLFSTPIFVGFDNFQTILFDQDSLYHTQFFNGMKNTLFFAAISVPLCIVIPLLLAVALYAKPKMMRFFQSILYLPTLFAISAVMIIWGFLLSKSFGPIKEVFGIDINFVGTQPWAWIAILIVTIWWTLGGNLIIYVAALNGVSKEQLEAAELDGANSITKFFRISLPSIRNQLVFTTVMTTIAQFNIYGQPLMLTGGGPNNSTRVLMMYIQENAFGSSTSVAGISSAMAILLGFVIMAVSIVQFMVIKKMER
ncbi:carbohydrate ABC transporter permease [Enterococcus sp. CR-Ec1]|uniref:carbohydrate ABC transporter permease n=1 Tax=Enterococcus sp. CR-Ec1 TaxID=2057791 RepID=UPI000C763230|nr:sugar ABC transporter permease [Enterococcus sp. CR-Ec1]AUJ86697.1 ABC transporter permease [Enterococcus sp. CR-Ec1]